MKTPGRISLTDLAGRVSVTRKGSAICATITPAGAATARAASHWVSLKPARLQPGISRRASYCSPSNSLLARMGPAVVSFHDGSLATVARVPSEYSSSSWTRGFRVAETAHPDGDGGAGRPEAAVAEHHADGVAAAGELAGDVVGDVLDALVVLGEAGGEHVIADARAVAVKLEEPESGDVSGGAVKLALDGEFLAQHARRQHALFAEADVAPGRGAVSGDVARGRVIGGPGGTARDEQGIAGGKVDADGGEEAGGLAVARFGGANGERIGAGAERGGDVEDCGHFGRAALAQRRVIERDFGAIGGGHGDGALHFSPRGEGEGSAKDVRLGVAGRGPDPVGAGEGVIGTGGVAEKLLLIAADPLGFPIGESL